MGGVFACCADPLAESLLGAATDALGSAMHASKGKVDDAGARRHVLRRLVAAGHVAGAQKVARQSPELTNTFDSLLAEHGHVDAQERLLQHMVDRARARKSLVHDDMGWMTAVEDPRLLEPLFALLGSVWKTSDKPIPRISSGPGLHDVTSPVMAGIRRIGGEDAINGYDALLARGGDARRLHAQREELAASLLRLEGLDMAETASADAHLPVISRILDEAAP